MVIKVKNSVTAEQAAKFGLSLSELQTLAHGKDCATYPGSTLHVRRSRGGKVTVFNISEQARNEKIKASKAAKKGATSVAPALEANA